MAPFRPVVVHSSLHISCLIFLLTASGCGESMDSEVAGNPGTLPQSSFCGTPSLGTQALEKRTSPLVSPDVNDTVPAFGRPAWNPFNTSNAAIRSAKRVTWTVRKSYNAANAASPGPLTQYSKRASNAFILNEFRKALVSWATTADLEFPFVASGRADMTFELNEYQNVNWTGLWSNPLLKFNELQPDLVSLPSDAPPAGTTTPPAYAPYRTAVHDGNSYLYATALHEIGHALGFGHAFDDRWHYNYADSDNGNYRQCDAGGLCYPHENDSGADFAIMDYRNGNYGGRHPRGRILTAYEQDYAQAIYGTAALTPFFEMTGPEEYNNHTHYVGWGGGGWYLDFYSYVNHQFSNGGRETEGAISNLMGGIRQGTPGGAFIALRYFTTVDNYYPRYGIELSAPAGFNDNGPIGLIRNASGQGFTTPLYRHYSAASGTYRLTTNATSPVGFTRQALLGYINGSPSVPMHSALMPFDDSVEYAVISRSSGKPVGTVEFNNLNGVPIVNAPVRPAEPRWTFINAGEGYYRIKEPPGYFNKVFGVAANSAADGAKIQSLVYKGLGSQDWRIEETTTAGYYRLVARHNGKCLEVPSTAVGTQLVQRTCGSGSNHQFRLVKRTASFTDSSYFKLIARHSKKAIDVVGASMAEGAQIQQLTPSNGDNQRWRLVHTSNARGDRLIYMTAKHSGKLMEINGGATNNGALAVQRGSTLSDQAMWAFNVNAEGYYEIVNAKTGKCLDVDGNASTDGLRLTQWTCTKAQDQQFDVVLAE